MTVETGWVTVARTSQVQPGTVEVFQVDGRALCVGQTTDGEWARSTTSAPTTAATWARAS